jgi:ATP-dependent Clp protease ATP-binding subunit ClpA
MRSGNELPRGLRPSSGFAADLSAALSERVIGQPVAIRSIVPYIQMHNAGLAPEGRPAGVFLLLGPTGTGKTRTVEAIAEQIHGSQKNLLRVDCGEFQMEHEVAKLLGAPPGYLGHRETQPMLTQQKVNAAASPRSDLSIILFDEIEKAAPSMNRLLLGILDKAVLRLGDNTIVNFEKTIIFLTSNLGSGKMTLALRPNFGFEALIAADRSGQERERKLERIGMAAVRKRFPPEFVNRIDRVITYQPLSAAALARILTCLLYDLQSLLDTRLGLRTFHLHVPPRSRTFLLREGASEEFGARELKRTLHRYLLHPLAADLAAGRISPGSVIRADLRSARLVFTAVESDDVAA